MWIALLCLTARAEDDLGALQAAALEQHPSLEARRARIRAIQERARVAGIGPDPSIAVELSNTPVDTFALTQHPMSGIQLRVQQTVRPPGWSGSRKDATRAQADAEVAALDEAELALEKAVAQAWWRLTENRQRRTLTQDHVERIGSLREAVTARYQVGEAGQSAVLQLEVLEARLTDELSDFDRAETEWVALLETATGMTTFDTPDLTVALEPPNPDDWTTTATRERPAYTGLQAREAEAQALMRVASADALPSPTVWAGYRVRLIQTPTDAGTDFVSVGVGVPIPTASARKASGTKAAQAATIQAVGSERRALTDTIEAEGRRIHADWARAHGKATTYGDRLIPSARAVLETTATDYSVGRADFASLVDAEVALLELERARITASVQTHIHRAEAAALLGGSPD